ncbi:fibroblast growth factor 21 isoform X2 [Myxocyprinus asiaticus]|uniref:fibroblast growth factor 21 isoform X2 n=1 Tax=Myxocyprinus asiaticus TaxID=70543 RepID=UPI0022236933|nr:fibroblast growth factor 21 isoform X2 [Myxocyprinus asiaticus]
MMPAWSAQSIMLFASFYILLVLFPSLHWCMYVPAQSVLVPFSTQVRERLLYTENRRQGLFLEMNADGSVKGSTEQNSNCVLELRSVKAGETVIRGVVTSLFLCVNNAGNLRGQYYIEEDCTFQELLLADGYSLFLSPHNGLPVSLLSKQSGKRHSTPFSRFLPILNTQFTVSAREEDSQMHEVKQHIQDINLDSDDPLGMGHQSHIQTVFSPSLHTKK